MAESFNLRNDYKIARCCKPSPGDKITGFLKPQSGIIAVHKTDCVSLRSIQPERLVKLIWDEITTTEDKKSSAYNPDLRLLDEIDFRILNHHEKMGVDYAAVVAKSLRLDRAVVFERHKKLRDLGLLIRVQPKMIQYRKGIVKNKWIKHRNHTYYEITEKGRAFLELHESIGNSG